MSHHSFVLLVLFSQAIVNYNKLGKQKLAGVPAEASGDDVQGFSHMIFFLLFSSALWLMFSLE